MAAQVGLSLPWRPGSYFFNLVIFKFFRKILLVEQDIRPNSDFLVDRAFLGPTIGGVLVEQWGFPWACFGVVIVFGVCVSKTLMLFLTVDQWNQNTTIVIYKQR